jgi:hypothetical protein
LPNWLLLLLLLPHQLLVRHLVHRYLLLLHGRLLLHGLLLPVVL